MEEPLDLLSREREKLFSLLEGLLTTSPEGILLQGPEGIGRTFFLQRLKARLGDRFCLLHGYRELGQFPYERKEGLIIAIDDGDTLPPGLLEELFQYWQENRTFSWIVTLSPEGLFLKSYTDRKAVEELKVIDLPPLTRAETERYLAELLKGHAPFGKEIGEEIFFRSHGVPGRVQEELNRLLTSGRPHTGSPPYFLYAAALLVTLTTAAAIWWLGRPPPEEPALEHLSLPETPSQPEGAPVTKPEEPFPSEGEATLAQPVQERPSLPREGESSTPPPEVEPGGEAEEGVTPVLVDRLGAGQRSGTQEREAASPIYTLQLAAFRKKARAEAFLAQYPELKGAEILPHTTGGRLWYVVIYGRYATLEEAKRAREGLPKGIAPWIRKVSDLRGLDPDLPDEPFR